MVLSVNLPQILSFSQITQFLCCHSMAEVSLCCWLTPRQWCSPPCSPFHASFASCSCHVFISQLCSSLFPLLLHFPSHTACSTWLFCMSERVAGRGGTLVAVTMPGEGTGAALGCSRMAACDFREFSFPSVPEPALWVFAEEVQEQQWLAETLGRLHQLLLVLLQDTPGEGVMAGSWGSWAFKLCCLRDSPRGRGGN